MADELIKGKGFRAELPGSGIVLFVELGYEGWRYVVYRPADRAELKKGLCESIDPEKAKVEAVTIGLLRIGDDRDADAVNSILEWRPYGPGHGPVVEA